ncbi:MAG: uracil-DNA glycosylase [Proteobacteria bacterium]|nr:uracil-DNA glycosylase [Pseudomonadota bacterium]
MHARDLRYLEALGIELWVPRAAAVAGGPAVPAAPDAVPAATAAVPAAPPMAEAPAVPADSVAAWAQLRREVMACTRCGLHTTRTQGVFGVGPARCDWLVIGEAPGAEEDRRGEPFVGAAGQLLDKMLQAIGLDRTRNVYIANILKSRPPGNRDPGPEEVTACMPYLLRQIGLLQPKIMLAVGRIAAQNLLQTDVPLGRLRGRAHAFGASAIPLVVTYHPAYLLRTPADKRKAWEDLKFARDLYAKLTAAT